jgi:hypothetical protein
VLIGPGEEEQVLDQPLHPEVLGEHRLGQLADGGTVRVSQRDLCVLSNGGNR